MKHIKKFPIIKESAIEEYVNSFYDYKKKFENIIESQGNYYNISIHISTLIDEVESSPYIKQIIQLREEANLKLSSDKISEEEANVQEKYLSETDSIMDKHKEFINVLTKTKEMYSDLYDNVKYLLNFKF